MKISGISFSIHLFGLASTGLLVDLGVDVVMTAGVLLKKQSVSLQIPFISLVFTKGN